MKRSIPNKILPLTVLACGLWTSCLWAQPAPEDLAKKREKVQKLFASVPLLPQNMRPMETLAFSCIQEESTDNGVSWTVVKKSKVAFDVRKGHLKLTEWRYDPERKGINYRKHVRFKDKLYQSKQNFGNFDSFQERSHSFPENWGKCRFVYITQCDSIRDINRLIMNIDWRRFWETNTETNQLISDVISNQSLRDEIGDIILKDASDEVMIAEGSSLFVVNKRMGTVVRRLVAPYTLDGKLGSVKYTADRFVSIKGVPIPLVVTASFPCNEPGSPLLKTLIRMSVDEKTLRINEEIPPSEFHITVEAGTEVWDGIKQKQYVLTAPLETLDHSDSIKHLDAMLEEARKAK